MRAVEVGSAPIADLGESVLWDHRSSSLLWVDILAGRVFRRRAEDAETEVFRFDEPVGFVALVGSDGYGIGLGNSMAYLDADMAVEHVVPGSQSSEFMFTDGAADPHGNLVAGTLPRPAEGTSGGAGVGRGMLHRTRGGVCEVLLTGVSESNGLSWPHASTMYYVDSATLAVESWDYSDSPSGREVVAQLHVEDGYPDGICLDADLNIWVACWEGGAVRCFSPTGELLQVVEVPTPLVTSCAFGGEDLRQLFITTASVRYSEESHADPMKLGGRLFVADVGVAGRAEWCATPPGT